MLIVATIYASLKLAMRLVIYTVLGGLVIIVRHHNRKKSRREMDKDTEKFVAKTKKDSRGKYPWEP
ncbi:hypothetical protein RA086_01695 [Lactiplantibacillus sp. WILCCON 0030]|uniref:Uncharacterized protein n=1 Tax=Lactiplantibacillus brownii TaxID=3069269 RepID=A0ABU1A5Y2_9LACO|nr:hypothetical protein [Lactiplantibacillus brownii]MDQ7936366.1 hypothetical protein [Lactiplantibacillus brownii]